MPENVMGTRVGAFAILLSGDGESIYFFERGSKYAGTEKEGFGFFGGHNEVQDKEAAIEGLDRELREELLFGTGSPILSHPIQESRLTIVNWGIDYGTWGKKGEWQAGTCWHGHTYRLLPGEESWLVRHLKEMGKNAEYAEQVRAASNQEMGRIVCVSLLDLCVLARNDERNEIGSYRFAYPHEYATLLKLLRSRGLI